LFKKMALKKCTSLAIIAIAASIWIGCSSKEDKAKYDNFYGSGSKAREEAALTVLQAEKRNTPAPAQSSTEAKPAADSTKAAPAADTTAAAPAQNLHVRLYRQKYQLCLINMHVLPATILTKR
jgi:hypothetical protein